MPEALRILVQEEANKLIDMDTVTKEAIERVQQTGIIFIDEIDKVASRGHSHGPDVSREGVQRDLLPVVEGTTVTTKARPRENRAYTLHSSRSIPYVKTV